MLGRVLPGIYRHLGRGVGQDVDKQLGRVLFLHQLKVRNIKVRMFNWEQQKNVVPFCLHATLNAKFW